VSQRILVGQIQDIIGCYLQKLPPQHPTFSISSSSAFININMLGLIFQLFIHHIAFLALFLDPEFWAYFASYHDDTTKAITHRWEQLQTALQTPPTLNIEEDSDDEYEQLVDNEIKRFQHVLREIGALEAEMEKAKEVGFVVKKTRKWIEDIWVAGASDLG
jgi:hypothetical protein